MMLFTAANANEVFAKSSFAEKDLCKALGLWWSPENKRWAITMARLNKLQTAQVAAMVQYAGDEQTRVLLAGRAVEKVKTVEASRAVDANVTIPAPAGLEYLPFQKAGIAFAGNRPGVLIADEMGLGKTIQAIGVINSDPSIRAVLVVCPASLKLNWAREAARWMVQAATVTVHNADGSSRVTKDGGPNSVTIDIANYEAVRDREDLQARVVDLLVVDEAHYCKNQKTQRAVAVKRVASSARRRVVLTGTPIANRPVELYPILGLVDSKQFPESEFFRYAKRYCAAYKEFVRTPRGSREVWNFSGSSNEAELQEMLRGSVMVRRLKADVLTELPPKRRQIVVLPQNGAAKVVAKQAEYLANMQAAKNHVEAMALLNDEAAYAQAVAALDNEMSVAFTAMSALRRESAIAKVPQAVQHIRDCLEDNSNKIIVMAHHHDVIAKLSEQLGEFGVVTVTGATSIDDRQAAVDAFQSNPNVRVFVGNILAAGVGLTLTAAAHVVFVELDWVPGNIKQAEDRAHRIGQRDSVLVQHLVFEDSIDVLFAEALVEKQRVIDMALDAHHSESAAADAIAAAQAKAFAAAAAEAVKAASAAARAPMAQGRKDAILAALRILSDRCDGAVHKDGSGFNGRDSKFGKALAMMSNLTDNQANAAARMLVTYRNTQVPADLASRIWG